MEIGLSPGDCVRWGPSPSRKRGVAPTFGPRLLWQNGYVDQDATCYVDRPRPIRDTVLNGDPAPLPKRAQPPFSANVRCGQTAGWTKMSLGMEAGLGPGNAYDGDPATPRKKVHHPNQFLAHVYCGQTGGWIKTPRGAKVNLGPGDVVLDGVAAPPP